MINLHLSRANTFYGFRSRDYERMGADMATVKFEHDFSDGLQVRNQLRYGRSTRDSNATPPRFASNDSTVINRELRAWTTEDGIWDNQTDLRANFATGPIKHALIAGAAFTNENNIRKTRTGPNSPTTLLNPNPDDIYTGVITTSPDRWGHHRKYSGVVRIRHREVWREIRSERRPAFGALRRRWSYYGPCACGESGQDEQRPRRRDLTSRSRAAACMPPMEPR